MAEGAATENEWEFLRPWWTILQRGLVSALTTSPPNTMREVFSGFYIPGCHLGDRFQAIAMATEQRDAFELVFLLSRIDSTAFVRFVKEVFITQPIGKTLVGDSTSRDIPSQVELTIINQPDFLRVLVEHVPMNARSDKFRDAYARLMAKATERGVTEACKKLTIDVTCRLNTFTFATNFDLRYASSVLTQLASIEKKIREEEAHSMFRWRELKVHTSLSPTIADDIEAMVQPGHVALSYMQTPSYTPAIVPRWTGGSLLLRVSKLCVGEESTSMKEFVPICASMLEAPNLTELDFHVSTIDTNGVQNELRCMWSWLWYSLFCNDARHDELYRFKCTGPIPIEAVQWFEELVSADNLSRFLLPNTGEEGTNQNRVVTLAADAVVYAGVNDDKVVVNHGAKFRVLSESGSRVEIVVPGYGVCFVDPISTHTSTDATDTLVQWELKRHTIRSIQMQIDIHGSCSRLLGLIGSPLTRIELGGATPESDATVRCLDLIWNTCVNLSVLMVDIATEAVLQSIVDAYDTKECRVTVLRLGSRHVVSEKAMVNFLVKLSDMNQMMSKVLKELWLEWSVPPKNTGDEDGNDHVTSAGSVEVPLAALKMLESNSRLQVFVLQGTEVPDEVRAAVLTVKKTMTKRSTYAILSVIHNVRSRGRGEALGQLDTGILARILEMAGPSLGALYYVG